RTARAFLLLVLVPRPPASTLFPYTTLFRSLVHDVDAGRQAPQIPARVPEVTDDPGREPVGGEKADRSGDDTAEHGEELLPSHRGDRKSTRLNSSHVKISYAVFCLKKKNKQA